MKTVVIEVFEINQFDIGAVCEFFKKGFAQIFVVEQEFGVF